MASKKYTREEILRSEQFEKYQKDFLAVLLDKPEYTLSDAKKIASDFFERSE